MMPILGSQYAETHYKFRLPWSPLWRPRPEVIADAPAMVVAGAQVPLFLAIHDAHKFPVTLHKVRVVLRAGGQMLSSDHEFGLKLDQPFHFIDLPWPGPEIPGENLIDVLFTLIDAKGRKSVFVNHSLPGLPTKSLSVLRLQSALPYPEHWIAGDLHCHTTWSEDPVEWGGNPAVMQRAAHALGLGFFAATDHSYDFAWQHPDWMQPADPNARFAQFRAEIDRLAQNPNLPLVIPSEEVSCGNSRGENVHLLVIGHPDYLPGQGDGGRRWLNNRPDLTIAEVLERIAHSGAAALAAHPQPGIGWLQRKIFRRGEWQSEDLLPGLHGLQFWNGKPKTDFDRGRALWVQDLLRGNRRLPIAGNDSHGDLNRATHVRTPLLTLGQTNKHRFGMARTLLHVPDAPTTATVSAALHDHPCSVTDGPFLSLLLPNTRWSTLRSPNAQGAVHFHSLPEFGGATRLRVSGQLNGTLSETTLFEQTMDPQALHWEQAIDLPAGLLWARAEVETRWGQRALTAAVEPG